MTRFKQATLAVAVGTCGVHGLAQGFVNVYEIPHNVSINVIANQRYHENINKTLHHWDNQPLKDRYKRPGSLPLAQSNGQGIAVMTQGLPREQAAAGGAAYRQALGFHEQVIRKFGLPSGDLGVALASSIAGAWMAYNNQPFPDQYFVPLVTQMRERLASSAALQSLSDGDRTTTYESLAVTGMMLASSQITWQRNPRAPGADALRERMRTQGGETLTRMLQVPPDQVAIGPQGLISQASATR
ncbi:DUF6683 family protein [Roseateles asaccharophilus]|uniref:Uncharacterized protein n=1 Tax=Roseateles asaccharophilus TaxID=582607 RepID=A0ABU2A883_9BURK|nr:DUF6683 family protein [Roseateles asaccharophilus]MDR7333411.1 hypothetical protein [Roseateles asaccharophilus]